MGGNRLKTNSNYQGMAGRVGDIDNFRDYHVEKDVKVKEHIDHNYDGGSSFFKASYEHENMRKKHLKETGDTLKAQM